MKIEDINVLFNTEAKGVEYYKVDGLTADMFANGYVVIHRGFYKDIEALKEKNLEENQVYVQYDGFDNVRFAQYHKYGKQLETPRYSDKKAAELRIHLVKIVKNSSGEFNVVEINTSTDTPFIKEYVKLYKRYLKEWKASLAS